jgi:hypothetical protein
MVSEKKRKKFSIKKSMSFEVSLSSRENCFSFAASYPCPWTMTSSSLSPLISIVSFPSSYPSSCLAIVTAFYHLSNVIFASL